MSDPTVRQARPDDQAAVAAFTEDTWADQGFDDYIPGVFPEWIEDDGEDERTVVIDVGGEACALAQGVLQSEYEAWFQGLRVAAEHRGRGFSERLTEHLCDWAREHGATIGRNMVFSWNDAGLGQSRAAGFAPGMEGRWAGPDPDSDAEPAHAVVEDPDAVWSCWNRSDARDRLGGLAIDPGESWSLSTLTRETLHDLKDDQRVLAIQDESGTQAVTARVRTREAEAEDGSIERGAVYGFSAWNDRDAARSLFDAIAADAADLGVEHTRVLIPESCRHVSDAASVRANPGDEPIFVLERDLTGEY